MTTIAPHKITNHSPVAGNPPVVRVIQGCILELDGEFSDFEIKVAVEDMKATGKERARIWRIDAVTLCIGEPNLEALARYVRWCQQTAGSR